MAGRVLWRGSSPLSVAFDQRLATTTAGRLLTQCHNPRNPRQADTPLAPCIALATVHQPGTPLSPYPVLSSTHQTCSSISQLHCPSSIPCKPGAKRRGRAHCAGQRGSALRLNGPKIGQLALRSRQLAVRATSEVAVGAQASDSGSEPKVRSVKLKALNPKPYALCPKTPSPKP